MYIDIIVSQNTTQFYAHYVQISSSKIHTLSLGYHTR